MGDSLKTQIAELTANPELLKNIKNPSKDIQLAVIDDNPFNIRFLENPLEDIQLRAVNKDGKVVNYINNPSDPVKLAAIKEHPSVIRGMSNTTEEMQLAAVSAIPFLINNIIHFDSPITEKVHLTAFESGLKYKKENIGGTHLDVHMDIDFMDGIVSDKSPEKVKLAAVNFYWPSIEFFSNPSDEVKLTAIKKKFEKVQCVEGPNIQALNDVSRGDLPDLRKKYSGNDLDKYFKALIEKEAHPAYEMDYFIGAKLLGDNKMGKVVV